MSILSVHYIRNRYKDFLIFTGPASFREVGSAGFRWLAFTNMICRAFSLGDSFREVFFLGEMLMRYKKITIFLKIKLMKFLYFTFNC